MRNRNNSWVFEFSNAAGKPEVMLRPQIVSDLARELENLARYCAEVVGPSGGDRLEILLTAADRGCLRLAFIPWLRSKSDDIAFMANVATIVDTVGPYVLATLIAAGAHPMSPVKRVDVPDNLGYDQLPRRADFVAKAKPIIEIAMRSGADRVTFDVQGEATIVLVGEQTLDASRIGSKAKQSLTEDFDFFGPLTDIKGPVRLLAPDGKEQHIYWGTMVIENRETPVLIDWAIDKPIKMNAGDASWQVFGRVYQSNFTGYRLLDPIPNELLTIGLMLRAEKRFVES